MTPNSKLMHKVRKFISIYLFKERPSLLRALTSSLKLQGTLKRDTKDLCVCNYFFNFVFSSFSCNVMHLYLDILRIEMTFFYEFVPVSFVVDHFKRFTVAAYVLSSFPCLLVVFHSFNQSFVPHFISYAIFFSILFLYWKFTLLEKNVSIILCLSTEWWKPTKYWKRRKKIREKVNKIKWKCR